MRQFDADRTAAQIARGGDIIGRLKTLYKRLFPCGGKPPFVMTCYSGLLTLLSAPHRRLQNEWFPSVREEVVCAGKLMVFLVPATDVVNGGLMSICNVARRSRDMRELHGCSVVLATMPGGATISGFSRFDCDERIFRFEQLTSLFPDLETVYIQLPEICAAPFLTYLRRRGDSFRRIPDRRLNILDQNIEFMPDAASVRDLASFFGQATQTCAHGKYCTPAFREKYGIPTHLLPADIPTVFYQIPYREKEDLIAYSNDPNSNREYVLEELRRRLPGYSFVMIENMSFDEYKRTISRAKWTLTFGEGWDGYYLQPYFSSSIGFAVFNETFCPPHMRGAPTAFPDYETLPERMAEFIRTYDSEELYEKKREEIRAILFPPPPPGAVPYDALLEFYRGNYTIP